MVRIGGFGRVVDVIYLHCSQQSHSALVVINKCHNQIEIG